MNQKVNDAFNQQINRELYSAYLYLAMQEYLQKKGFKGAAHWMTIQVQEEMAHATGLIKWVQAHDGDLELKAIDRPEADFSSYLDVFEKALAHEKFVTASINDLAQVCESEKDRASRSFLDWYIMEQVEEEENGRDNIQAIQHTDGNLVALMAFDSSLGGRVYNAPVIPHVSATL